MRVILNNPIDEVVELARRDAQHVGIKPLQAWLHLAFRHTVFYGIQEQLAKAVLLLVTLKVAQNTQDVSARSHAPRPAHPPSRSRVHAPDNIIDKAGPSICR